MRKLFKKYFLLFLLFITIVTHGQSHIIQYVLTYKPSQESNKKSSQLYFLDILNNESVFRSENNRNSDSLKSSTGYGLAKSTVFNEHLYIKKDLKDNLVYKFITMPLSMDKFNVKIEDPLSWKLTSETKTIENIKCQKAEVGYGGRYWIAWFSEEINIPDGPYIFKGLPGLIIQIYDKDESYMFKLSKIGKKANTSLFSDNVGKQISWDEYEKIQLDYYNDPFVYVKSQNLKTATDDGMGGMKKVDFREMTLSIREKIKENDNQPEKDKIIKYPK